MITDPLFYVLAVVAVVLQGLSKGGFLGLGLMSLPLMSLTLPPMQAAAIILPTVLAQDALTVWFYRRTWSAWNLKVMIPGMMAGLTLGWLFAASLSAAHVRLAIGLIAGTFVLRQWLGNYLARLAPSPDVATGLFFGILGGFTTMLANAGGPAWQMHLLPQKLDKFSYVGTFAMLFAASNLLKIPAYGALGQLTFENMAMGMVLLPAAVLGNYAGIWLVRRTPAELFYRIAYVLMLLIAIELIRGALVELWRTAAA
ncbi:MAG: sulfite exporter TauE/SafE family protein [Xanthobacteraceae bacterium]